jgi:hypothetical protein
VYSSVLDKNEGTALGLPTFAPRLVNTTLGRSGCMRPDKHWKEYGPIDPFTAVTG